MQTKTISGTTYGFVQVPKGGSSIRLAGAIQDQLIYRRPGFISGALEKIPLPLGNWVLLGKADEIDEETAAGIVESNQCSQEYKDTCPSDFCKKQGCSGMGQYYYYSDPMDFDSEPAYSATESLKSLIASLGMDFDTCVVLKEIK